MINKNDKNISDYMEDHPFGIDSTEKVVKLGEKISNLDEFIVGKQIYFAEEKGKSFDRAMEAYKELAEGESLEKVIKDSDESILQVPDTLMNLSKLREYIGPSLMQIAKDLKPGQFTPPKKVKGGYKIIYLVDRRDALPPDFNEIRDRVKSEYLKRRDDQALRDYLDKLKNWYEIERHPKI